MAIVRQRSLSKIVESPEKLTHQHLTAERMQDVHLLLQNLVNSEEATVKLVLDCLYDIGAVNLIEHHQMRWLTAITVVALSALNITITILNNHPIAPLQSQQSIPSLIPD